MTRLAIALALVTSISLGQGISATVTPNPAPPGVPIDVVVTDAGGQGLTFTDTCIVKQVRQDSPTGPVVFSPWCLFMITNVAPGGSISGQWGQTDDWGTQVMDGTYWMKVRYQVTGNSTYHEEWFPVVITSDPIFPTLGVTPGSAAAIGQNLSLDVTAPGRPGWVYVTAASFTTNVGQAGGLIHLDNDPLFQLSTMNPFSVFNNMVGTLDSLGNTTGIGIDLPMAPFLQNLPLHFQAVVQNPATLAVEVTNSVHLTIL